ncbi:ketohexokinase-like isoform X2 [Culicoides brevitarsis]|uniref:ketohexokinase-like isoform X2 n=1 Tax=Culicoides brevitarsis TaxID=469753 RepID=UPI00307C951C
MTDWNSKKILLVGETVLDIIQIVSEYPKEDDDIRSNHGWWQRGGNASNNATVLSLLGEKCEILSNFSSSEMFKFVVADLTNRGIDHKNCLYFDDCEVPLSTIWISEANGSRTIVHSNPNLPHVNFETFDKCDLDEYKWIHFEGRTPLEFRKMMEKTRKFNSRIKISVELEKLRGDDLKLVENADFVFLGKTFAKFIGCEKKEEAVYKLKELAGDKNNFTVICPWETEGVAVLDQENNFYSCEAFKAEKVRDTLGAGDTFCAATIFALNQGRNVQKAIEFGSTIAGLKVGFYGYDGIKDACKKFL